MMVMSRIVEIVTWMQEFCVLDHAWTETFTKLIKMIYIVMSLKNWFKSEIILVSEMFGTKKISYTCCKGRTIRYPRGGGVRVFLLWPGGENIFFLPQWDWSKTCVAQKYFKKKRISNGPPLTKSSNLTKFFPGVLTWLV